MSMQSELVYLLAGVCLINGLDCLQLPEMRRFYGKTNAKVQICMIGLTAQLTTNLRQVLAYHCLPLLFRDIYF